MGKTEEEFIEEILEDLESDDSDTRLDAANKLGAIFQERFFDILLVLLYDTRSIVKAEAARALGNISNPRAIRPLLDLLGDEDNWVRRVSVDSLSRLESVDVVEELFQHYNRGGTKQKLQALNALVYLKDKKTKTRLVNLLSKERDLELRGALLKTLIRIVPKEEAEKIINQLKSVGTQLEISDQQILEMTPEERIKLSKKLEEDSFSLNL
jgi:HEAT repeat protein